MKFFKEGSRIYEVCGLLFCLDMQNELVDVFCGRQQAIALHRSTVRLLEGKHGLAELPEFFRVIPKKSHKADRHY